MKNRILISILLFSLLLSNCQEPYIRFNPLSDESNIIVPDTIKPQESINDPQQTGVACNYNSRSSSFTELIDIIEIPNDLPEDYDLSSDMPPVRSQGNQGSCVAWATSYYLKSYQEKIQHDYEYLSYENVMSPAFVYNQSKANDNCNSGSAIASALDVLKEYGVNNWKDFPYSDTQCSNLPTEELLNKASQNKIKEYFQVGIPDSNLDSNYTLINLIKTLVYQKNPIVIALDWKDLIFETQETELIATSFSQNPTDECGHAVLIVGYDNQMSAFKIVNSWGTSFGNGGYAWIHYNFFLSDDNNDFEKGLEGSFIAYDED
jgi:C1A family cysteine protease